MANLQVEDEELLMILFQRFWDQLPEAGSEEVSRLLAACHELDWWNTPVMSDWAWWAAIE